MADSITPTAPRTTQPQPVAVDPASAALGGASGATATLTSKASTSALPVTTSTSSATASASPSATVATPTTTPRTTADPTARDNYAAASSGGASQATGGGASAKGNGGQGGSLEMSGNGGSESNIAIAAGAAGEVANLTRMSAGAGNSDATTVTVHAENLGNPSAMTKDLLDALAAGKGQASPSEALAQATALVAMAQKAVDNIPHRLVDTSAELGTKLYQAPAQNRAESQQTAELAFLRTASLRVQASESLSHGPEWPAMMLEGLARASATWAAPKESLGAAGDALVRASMALYGRDLGVLTAKHPPEDIFRAASLANAPLALPASALLDVGGELQGFVVLQTSQSANGEQALLLLDVGQSIAEGAEVHKAMQAEKFVQALNVLLVPNGKPAISTERSQEDALNTLGLIGCCLASSAGSVRPGGSPIRTTGSRGRGLLENRCLTCAQAQLMCQPGYVPPAPMGRALKKGAR